MNAEMKKVLVKAFRSVVDRSRSERISLRTAAYSTAVERVARAEKLRGIYKNRAYVELCVELLRACG